MKRYKLRIPVPAGLRAVIVHPHLVLSTKEARRFARFRHEEWQD